MRKTVRMAMLDYRARMEQRLVLPSPEAQIAAEEDSAVIRRVQELEENSKRRLARARSREEELRREIATCQCLLQEARESLKESRERSARLTLQDVQRWAQLRNERRESEHQRRLLEACQKQNAALLRVQERFRSCLRDWVLDAPDSPRSRLELERLLNAIGLGPAAKADVLARLCGEEQR